MRICFILNNYPTTEDPIDAFIRPVVAELLKQGNECIIIAPQSITSILTKKLKKRKQVWTDSFNGNSFATIYQPLYLSFSNVKLFGRSISVVFQDFATRQVIRRRKIDFDILYSHFWTRGICAGLYGVKKKIPSVVVSGESRIDVQEKYPQSIISTAKKGIDGVIFVSSKNKNESIDLGLLDSETMLNDIIPNGYNPKDFYCIDKNEARQKIGIQTGDSIAIFVGTFGHRKGSDRVIAAAKQVSGLKLILIGDGTPPQEDENIVFKGRLPHEQLVYYLNAADFFVLPTLAEGCCNAIIEALACGLPVISSDLSFNYDVLDETCSLMIDPLSINQLANSMREMATNTEMRKKMSNAALEKARKLTIDKRVQRIQVFLQRITDKNKTEVGDETTDKHEEY